jgi:hypothetical protein
MLKVCDGVTEHITAMTQTYCGISLKSGEQTRGVPMALRGELLRVSTFKIGTKMYRLS